MSVAFSYRWISEVLITEMAARLEAKSSVVILSPPDGGKGFIRRSLRRRMREDGCVPIVSVNCRRNINDADSLKQLVERSVLEAGLTPGRGGGLLGALQGLHSRLTLFLANPDALPHTISRPLLQDLRSRVDADEGRLAALVCGEHDLSELVHGPASEFNVAYQYVIQGFDRDIFMSAYLSGYERELTAQISGEGRSRLFELSGGCGDQCRALLIGLVEYRSRARARPGFREEAIDENEVDLIAARLHEFGMSDRFFLRNVVRYLATEPKERVLGNFEKLVSHGRAPLQQPGGPPGSLTLSGLAVRRDGALYFSSPLIQQATQRYFTAERIAHLYAQAGRFDEAWRRLPKRGKSDLCQDLGALTSTIRAAGAEVYRLAFEGSAAVWAFVDAVARHVIGLSEVSIWRQHRMNGEWKPCFPQEPSAEMREAARQTLSPAYSNNGKSETLLVSGRWLGKMLAWRLEGADESCAFAIFVGDANAEVYIPKAVDSLLCDFARQFCGAHECAVANEETKRRTKFHATQLEVFERLQKQFAGGDPKLVDILAETKALLTLGYRRIAFTMYDPVEKKIHEVFDSAGRISVGPWNAEGRPSNVHSLAFQTKLPVFIENARQSLFTTKKAVDEGEIEAMVICPLLCGEEVIGTIHVERCDKLVPLDGEVRDFVEFGRSLGLLIVQSARLQMLQGTLDAARECLIAFDHRQQIRYVDQQAADLFGFTKGWTQVGRESTGKSNAEQLDCLREMAGHGLNLDSYVELKNPFPGSELVLSIKAKRLNNWKDQPVGSSVSALNLTEEYRVFSALTTLSQATDFQSGLSRLMEAVGVLGHKSARIYLESGGELRSTKHHRGFATADQEAMFNREFVISGYDSARCLKERRLIVFSLAKSSGQMRTSRGLVVELTAESNSYPVEKKIGDYWMDAPLLADGKAIGKISIDCDETFEPERAAFLEAFFSLASRLLEALSLAQKKAFNLSMAELSHNLFTQVTWLDSMVFLYRLHERSWDPDQLRRDTDRLETGLRRITESLARAKGSFAMSPPIYKSVDLLSLLSQVFPLNITSFELPEATLEIEADPLYLSEIFKELIQNSTSFKPQGLEIKVAVTTEEIAGVEWVVIDIRDNGPGFPEALRNGEEAFKHFVWQRSDEQSPGTGLGLAIVKQRVTLHGGNVRILPVPGACIRIKIPRKPIERAAG